MVVFPNVTPCSAVLSREIVVASRRGDYNVQETNSSPLLVNPFRVEGTGLTFADLIEQLRNSGLDHARKRDLISAINRYVAMTETNPGKTTTRVPEIRQKLLEIEPAKHHVTPKTWSNLKSNLLSAIELAGGPVLKTARVKLTSPWRDLLQHLPDRRSREGLSRFMRFCSANDVRPEQVNLQVLQQFETALHEGTFARQALTIKRDVATLWNRVAHGLPLASLTVLEIPSRRAPPTRVPLDALPHSFRKDLQEHLQWAAMNDPFADTARPRPLSPRSVRLREQYVKSAVTALVASGTRSKDIRSLHELTSPAAFKAILRQRLKGGQARTSAYDEGLAKALVAIAKEWVCPGPAVLEELKRLKSKLRPPPPGLTEKNKAVLREFGDPDLLRRLLALPDQLWAKAEGRVFSFRVLAAYEASLAIAILTFAPLRIANLASLEFGRTLRLPSRHGLCARIEIPGEEMKAGQPYMIELPPAVTRKLRIFADRLQEEHQRRLTFVFENGKGRNKPASTLSWLIKRTLKRHLGIAMTAHQFRHVMGDLIVSDEPSASSFETARQLLGHRNLSTTTRYYTGQNTVRAGRRHHELLQAKIAQVKRSPLSRKARHSQPATKVEG